MHVVLRVRPGIWLRQRDGYDAIRKTLVRYVGGDAFRIVHISIQQTHLHMIVEASDAKALTHGMQSFGIRCARALLPKNSFGKVFLYRYHATQIRTATYARNAVSYVLNNWRRHRADLENRATMAAKLDPYSSALAFTGWTQRFSKPSYYEPLGVSSPRTSLLRRVGSLDPWHKPGPLW